jgi:hypothetical protein
MKKKKNQLTVKKLQDFSKKINKLEESMTVRDYILSLARGFGYFRTIVYKTPQKHGLIAKVYLK